MNTFKSINEQVSAFADGELGTSPQDQIVKALREPAIHEAWTTYHMIGDTLRSRDSAVTLSAGFAERLAVRLAAEPTFLGNAAPSTASPVVQCAPHVMTANTARPTGRRFNMPGAALAATVLLAVAIGPRFYHAQEGHLASGAQPAGIIATAVSAHDGEAVLRNPQIDEYLVAHQRFSPSLYNTAQYARPSTFASESSK